MRGKRLRSFPARTRHRLEKSRPRRRRPPPAAPISHRRWKCCRCKHKDAAGCELCQSCAHRRCAGCAPRNDLGAWLRSKLSLKGKRARAGAGAGVARADGTPSCWSEGSEYYRGVAMPEVGRFSVRRVDCLQLIQLENACISIRVCSPKVLNASVYHSAAVVGGVEGLNSGVDLASSV
jgi:hypothetical protein